MDIIEIKNKFENSSIQKRIEFIESYDFKNDPENREYFIDFIKSIPAQKNEWYLMWLIDLAGLLEIKDISLLNQYLQYLSESNYYLLKLTVLDYVSYTHTLYQAESIDYSAIQFLLQNKYDRLIVKNVALLTLALLFPVEKERYMFMLKTNLLKSYEYKSHVRVYSFFLNRDVDSIIPKSFIKELIDISRSKDLGWAVESTILKVEEEYELYL